jgi:hypothetical protein
MMLGPDQRRQILDKTRDLILTKHINAIDPDQAYAGWVEQFQKICPHILKVPEEDFETEVQLLIRRLQSSHTTFFQGGGRSAIPAQYAINATFNPVALNGRETRWMFCDVIEDGPAHQVGIRPGHILLLQDRRDVLPPSPPTFRIGTSSTLTIGNLNGTSTHDVSVDIPDRQASIGGI